MTNLWRGRRVFVTGCTGLLGSWLVGELVQLGANVVGLVRDRVPQSNFVLSGLESTVSVVHGEVENRDMLTRVLHEYDIDTVFHLAAQTVVGTAALNPIATFSTNIGGTWNILESCRQSPAVRCVVIASSDKAYGEHDVLPYTEATPLRGRFPYDVSKSCADLIASAYHASYGVPVAITRCANLYGGGDWNISRIVPGTIRSLSRGERPVVRSDGLSTRDYLYVRDAVRAYLLIAEALIAGEIESGTPLNFHGETHSVLEVVALIARLMDRPDLSPVILSEATREIPHQSLSGEQAAAKLHWHREYDLEAGLRETITWYAEHAGVWNRPV